MYESQLLAQLKFNEWSKLDYVVLDTETTGLTKSSEILEISIVDKNKNILVNTLVRPKGRIPKTASDIHGITRDMVRNSPTFPEVWEQQVWPIIRDRKVLIYNEEYDLRLMLQSLKKWDEDIDFLDPINSDCVMKTYADLKGYSRWAKLEKACGHPIEHRALSDCMATLEVLQNNVNLDITYEPKPVETIEEVAITSLEPQASTQESKDIKQDFLQITKQEPLWKRFINFFKNK